MQYQLLSASACIKMTSDEGVVSFIPPDPANRDWQEYQVWLAEGNQPLPAE